MGQRTRRLIASLRITDRRLLQDLIVAWAGLVGLIAAVIALVPAVPFTWPRSIVLLVATFLLAGFYSWRRTQPTHLSIEEYLLDPVAAAFTTQSPSSRQLAAQANRIAHSAYGSISPIEEDRYEQWRLKNDKILACVLDRSRQVVAYFDVLPLNKSFFNHLKHGLVTEHDIRYEHILAPHHTKRSVKLYLAGIAVDSPGTLRGKRIAALTVWSLLNYLDHFYGAYAPHELLALGATSDGERLLQRFGFSIVAPASLRKDNLPLYGCTLDHAFLDRAARMIPAWTQSVCLSWKQRNQQGPHQIDKPRRSTT